MLTSVSGGAAVPGRRSLNAAQAARRQAFERRLDALDERARADGSGTEQAVRALLDELEETDHAVAGRAQHVLGLALAQNDRLVEALVALQQSRDRFTQAGERQSLGRLIRDTASLRGNQLGQTTEALEGYDDALAIAIEVGSAVDQGCVLNGMGVLFGRLERWEESERALRQAVDLLADTDVGTDLGRAVNNLGYLLALRGRPQEASATLSAAIDRVDPERDPRTVIILRTTLALVRAELGDFAGGLALLDLGSELLATADTYHQIVRLDAIGRIHLLANEPLEAIEFLRQAVAQADAHDIAALAVESVRYLAEAAERAGDLAGALAYERELRRRERSILDANAAAALRRTELTLQVEARNAENTALEAARSELAARVEERTAELRTEIDERRRAEERAAHLSRIDWLTGLPNRRHFEATLREWLGSTEVGVVGLCFVDLDRFKGVNDRYGHLVGDELLRSASDRMSALAPEAFVARFGGDEFVVMVAAASVGEVEQLADAIVEVFAQSLPAGSQGTQVSCSVGVALHPDDAGGADSLLQRADNALLAAKRAGGGCWRRLDPAGWEHVAYSNRVLGELDGAVRRGELSLVFQPMWRLSDGRCEAIEALLRWQHPVLGAIEPSVFIPMAEHSGAICPIGDWVVEHSCRAAALIDAVGHPTLSPDWSMCVNVSVRQLMQPGFSSDLADRVLGSGWCLERVELEVTESMQLSESEAVIASIDAVKRQGTRLAIDDFGTGYASFGHLERLGASRLKLDRSLVALLDGPSPRPSLPQAMISLGHSLGMVVTAEGVETQRQLQLLAQQHCDSVQGFALGRPVSHDMLRSELDRVALSTR